MKAFILTLICTIILSFNGYTQDVNKDLEIAENILASSLKNDLKQNSFYFPSSFEVTSNYSDQFGAMFTIKAKHLHILSTSGKVSQNLSIAYDVVNSGQSKKSEGRESKEDVIETVIASGKNFLAEYGHLIRGLGPDQHIMINLSPQRNNGFAVIWTGNNEGRNTKKDVQSVSIKIDKKSVDELRNGKIDRATFDDRIVIEELDEDAYKSEDMELMTSIFKRLYERDLAKTYFLSHSPPLYYEKTPNVGVHFFMKVYSSNHYDSGYSIPTKGLKGLTLDERNTKVANIYPEFLEELKENILEYSRVIKTLDNKDMISFEVNLTECIGCDIPESVTLSIPYEDVVDYEKSTISKSAAMDKFSVKEE